MRYRHEGFEPGLVFATAEDQPAAGVRVGQPHHGHGRRRRAAWLPNQVFPGYLNINRTQDFADQPDEGVGARHTFKAGFYNNHSFKAQNTGAGGVANLGFQGYVNFGNDTNNALDTGFGYSNAASGVFQQYLQQSKLIEGSMIYNNTEFYVQDNWKVNGRLTLDYGIRFTRQQPQYDQFLQMSNFFPNEWSKANAPLLYVSGCNNGAIVCSGNARNAVDPRTGQILTAVGAANTAAAIGTVVPGTGNLTNGIHQAGNGIADTSYVWPTLAAAPRFGMAYDLTGDQRFVLRAGGGLFFDRPDGNTVFSIPGQPADLDVAGSPQRPAADAGPGSQHDRRAGADRLPVRRKLPSSWQWQAGVQTALPWSLDARRRLRRQPRLQPGARVPGRRQRRRRPERHRHRRGVSPAEPGSDARSERGARRVGVHGEPAARVPRLQQHQRAANANTTTNTIRSRCRSTGASATAWRSARTTRSACPSRATPACRCACSTPPTAHLAALGSGGVRGAEREPRAAEARDQELCGVGYPDAAVKNGGDARQHPAATGSCPASSRPAPPNSRATQANGTAQANDQGNGRYDLPTRTRTTARRRNLTGSPDYAARIVFVGDPGSGCSDNQYKQFNTAAVDRTDLRQRRPGVRPLPARRLSRSHDRYGAGEELPRRRQPSLQFRLDVFNVFNTIIYNDRVEERHLPEPDGPDDRQLAVSGGRFARSGASDATHRGVRRRDRRAAVAEHAAADSVRVLTELH